MNKGLTIFVTATISGGVGGFIGYQIGKKIYSDLLEKEVKSIMDRQTKHDEYLLAQHSGKKESIKDSEIKAEEEPSKDAFNGFTKTDKTNYSKIIKKNYGDRREDKPVVINSTLEMQQDIFLITGTEYNESSNEFEVLHYHSHDGIITDENNNAISDFKKLIGSEEIWKPSFERDRQREVYVRNDNTKTDYEILLMKDAWSDIASPAQKAALLNLQSEPND